MKICVAQTKPVTGDIESNIEHHKKLIDLAILNGADTIIFPELSLTGYEPTLAKTLATHEDDSRFDDFQKIADTQAITIGVGVPLNVDVGICIGMVIFHPHEKRQVYSKKYLHADEMPFFVSGQNVTDFMAHKPNMALAICYELSVPEHAENAFRQDANVYIASVAKFKNGIEKAQQRLSEIAKRYSMTVLMSNCIGISDGGECAERTSVWQDDGKLVGQLDEVHEGILIFDTETQDMRRACL
ncbi:MAG: carbon-nitrogen hydrolase family protein [Candidatus Latescibacterota bacterium]